MAACKAAAALIGGWAAVVGLGVSILTLVLDIGKVDTLVSDSFLNGVLAAKTQAAQPRIQLFSR